MEAVYGFLLLLLAGHLHLSQGGQTRSRRDGDKIKVTTIEEPPYLMVRDTDGGPDEFEGFIPDLLAAIASRAGLTYDLQLVSDGVYGRPTSDGSWNGMIGEVLRREADVAAAPITISEERLKVLDFTEPFMSFGTTVLTKKPASFHSMAELAASTNLQYGLVKDGITERFFRKSTNPTYRKMWQYMEAHPDVLQTKMADGVRRVRESDGNYGFIIESSTADYWVHKYPCDLTKIGDINSENKYGFAIKSNANLLKKFNDAIKALKNNGELKKLKDKWWQADNKCGSAGNSINLALSSRHLVWTLATMSSVLYFTIRR